MSVIRHAVLVSLSIWLACGVDVAGQTADRFPINIQGNTGYMDGLGKLVIPAKYSEAGKFHEGVAAVLRDTKWGYVDSAGVEVVPPTYRGAGDFSEGVALRHGCGRQDRLHRSPMANENARLHSRLAPHRYPVRQDPASVFRGSYRGAVD